MDEYTAFASAVGAVMAFIAVIVVFRDIASWGGRERAQGEEYAPLEQVLKHTNYHRPLGVYGENGTVIFKDYEPILLRLLPEDRASVRLVAWDMKTNRRVPSGNLLLISLEKGVFCFSCVSNSLGLPLDKDGCLKMTKE